MGMKNPVSKSSYDPRKNPHPAIDGIEDRAYRILPVRSDIATIACIDDAQFERWYIERRKATETLLAQYELFASIPNLGYPSEEQKLGMDAITVIGGHINAFREGLEFLDVIRNFREYAKQEVGSVSEALKRPEVIQRFNERYKKSNE